MHDPLDLKLDGLELGTKYRMIQLLGGGGYGAVYLAEEIDPQRRRLRDTAIKVFPARTDDREQLRRKFEQFAREAERTAKVREEQLFVSYLTHETYDVVARADGTVVRRTYSTDIPPEEQIPVTLFLIVMEFADGGALGFDYRNQFIVNAKDDSYLNHLLNVAHGLKALHDEGTVHRDIKPNNLLHFRKPNLVKVADLGIATALEIRPEVGVVGTPPYMSPESFDGDDGPARDRYALAATTYELITGTSPFRLNAELPVNAPAMQVLAAWRDLHRTAPRPDAVRVAPTLISTHLSRILSRMLDADPNKRPQDLREFVEALQQEKIFRFPALRSRPTTVQPRALPQKPLQLSRYNLNPHFRADRLGERLHFLFVDFEHPNESLRGMLLSLADVYFGKTYSLCEVFGRHDAVLRVWCDPSRMLVEQFCEDVIRDVLFENRNAIQVMAIDEIAYVGADDGVAADVDIGEAKLRLNDAQQDPNAFNAREIERAERWLVNNNVFVRKRADLSANHKIKSYTLANTRAHVSQHEEQALFALLVRKLEMLRTNKHLSAISAFRRRYIPLQGVDAKRPLQSVNSPFLIKFLSSHYEDIIGVPNAIMGDLHGHGIRTSTMLATKRLLIESDRVGPQ